MWCYKDLTPLHGNDDDNDVPRDPRGRRPLPHELAHNDVNLGINGSGHEPRADTHQESKAAFELLYVVSDTTANTQTWDHVSTTQADSAGQQRQMIPNIPDGFM